MDSSEEQASASQDDGIDPNEDPIQLLQVYENRVAEMVTKFENETIRF